VRWTLVDVYERLCMAPPAGFEVGCKYLNSRGVRSRAVANTPGDTPSLSRVELLPGMHVGTQVHDS
jgi:hypothetical protein